MKFLILAALLACAMGAEHKPRWVLPRLPLDVLLRGNVPLYDANDEKIVGGSVVPANSIPFQLSLQRQGSLGGWSHMCGASILDSRRGLCAAHCTDGMVASDMRIVAGEHDLNTDSPNEQIRVLSSYVNHENYNSRNQLNDVSILHWDVGLTLNSVAAAVSLPAQGSNTAAGTAVTVSGWGTTSAGGSISTLLKAVDINVLADSVCTTAYGAGYMTGMMCAGNTAGGEDSCQGDSGGPLFTTSGRVQVGVVSWGRGCADAAYPGVYTEVASFRDWIDQH